MKPYIPSIPIAEGGTSSVDIKAAVPKDISSLRDFLVSDGCAMAQRVISVHPFQFRSFRRAY